MNSKDALMFLINQAIAKGGKAAGALGAGAGKGLGMAAEGLEMAAPKASSALQKLSMIAGAHPKATGATLAGAGTLGALAKMGGSPDAGQQEESMEPTPDDDEYLELLEKIHQKHQDAQRKKLLGQ